MISYAISFAFCGGGLGSARTESEASVPEDRRRLLLDDLSTHPRNRSYDELAKVLKAFGYQLRRSRGSHRIWRRDEGYPITLKDARSLSPAYARDVIEACEQMLGDEDAKEGESGERS